MYGHKVFRGIVAGYQENGVCASRMVLEILGGIVDFATHNKLQRRQLLSKGKRRNSYPWLLFVLRFELLDGDFPVDTRFGHDHFLLLFAQLHGALCLFQRRV